MYMYMYMYIHSALRVHGTRQKDLRFARSLCSQTPREGGREAGDYNTPDYTILYYTILYCFYTIQYDTIQYCKRLAQQRNSQRSLTLPSSL